MPEFFVRNRVPLLILGVGLALRLPLVFLPPEYLDAVWRTSDTAAIARNFLRNGYRLFYPQIDWGGVGPGYVETELPLHPFLVALLYGAFGERFWLGRLVSWAFTLGACLLFLRLARRVCGEPAANWALFFFVGAPLYFQYSIQFMPEALLLFAYLGALVAFHEWLEHGRGRALVWAAAGTALAILLKPTAIHIGLAFLLLLLRSRGWGAFADRRIWLFGVGCLAPATAWYAHARGLYLEYGNTFGILSGGDSKFGWLPGYWSSPAFYRQLLTIELEHVLSWAGVVLFAVGVVVVARRDEARLVAFGALAVAISYMIIPRYSVLAPYYHLYSVPYAALALGSGAAALMSGGGTKLARALRRSAALAVIGFMLLHQAREYHGLVTEPQYDPACARAVRSVVPPDEPVIFSSIAGAFVSGVPNNYQDPRPFYFSDRFGFSLPAEAHDASRVRRLRMAGAKYFVVQSSRIYRRNPELFGYLAASAVQVGPGVEEGGCGIYRFRDER